MNALTILLGAAVIGGAAAPAYVAPAAPPVITVHAKDFSFSGPKTAPAGPITFRLVNDGKEMHHITVIKLAKGKTMKDVGEAFKKQGPPPGWMTDMGGPNVAIPGGFVEATLNLEAGEYALVCFIPSPGSDMPHMAKGMVGSLTVTPTSKPEAMPKGDVTLTLKDYGFDFSKPLTAGKHTVSVQNSASQSHEVVFARLAPGKTVADLQNYLERDKMNGAPPGQPLAGLAAIAKGQSANFSVDLKPGNYAMICFVPDMKDGKSHSMHGMATQFAVK